MAKSDEKKFGFTVNGANYETRAQIEEGRDLLQKAGFDPAGDHVLIQLMRPGSKSIGLDEEVDLAEKGREEFRAFKSDRTYNFIAIDRGYEWGSSSISEAELREMTGITASEELVLELNDQPDQGIELGSIIELGGSGTERISKRRRSITIIVNAREEKVEADHLSYDQVVALAFQPVPTGPDVAFSITYRKGPAANLKGTLAEGVTVAIKDGMIFNVTQTNRS